MTRCHQCQSELLDYQQSLTGQAPAGRAATGFCAQCGVDLTQPPVDEGWTSIARLASLAEVGYFADLLDGREISTNVRQHNQFSAVDGGWQTTYYLQVPQILSAEATEALQRELEEMANHKDYNDTEEADKQPTPAIASWRPVVLVLVVGGIAYCAGRGGLQRPPAPPKSTDSLWQVFTEAPSPWEYSAGLDEPRRRLRYDDQTNRILLEEDFDHDGQFDSQRWFRQGELAVPPQP